MNDHRLRGLAGSMTALVTPFRGDFIDEQAFVHLCERQIERGSTALVPCSVTGEAPTLDADEQVRAIRLAVEASRGRVPVIAGIGSNCTDTAIRLAQRAQAVGADAALCVVPYYNRPTQEGLFRHFQAVQSHTDLPVLLHDAPRRCGVGLTLETLLRLAELPRIVGLEDSSGDLRRAAVLRRALGDDFLLLCGEDALLPGYLALGSQGAISVAANIVPALCAALHRAWSDNDQACYQELRDRLEILAEALGGDGDPTTVKWALARLGLIHGGLRLPLTPLRVDQEPMLRHALDMVVTPEADQAGGGVRLAAAG